MTSTCATTIDHRFAVQQTSDSDWLRATAVSLAADYLNGGRDAVEAFVRPRGEWAGFAERLTTSNRTELADYVEEGKSESLLFLVLMLTGACNADCPICFTDRRKKRHELTADQRDRLLDEAAALGAKYVYVPGEGEPTIDPGWWRFLDKCLELDLPAVVFTNGILFSDERACRRYWDMTCDEATARLADYPVSLYFKYWSADPDTQARLMKIDATQLDYEPVGSQLAPSGLRRLMEALPRERVGIEVCVERRNADEAVDTLVPFAEEHGLSRIVELIQHNGRTFGDPSYDPSPEQAAAVRPLLSPTSCAMATCKAVVTVQGFLAPRIAVLEKQIESFGRPVHVDEGPFFDLLHTTDYLVQRRYDLNCLCETLPLSLAENGEAIKVSPQSVVPPALTSAFEPQPAAPAQAATCACGSGGACCGGTSAAPVEGELAAH
jgi:organic radical activating enzyme